MVSLWGGLAGGRFRLAATGLLGCRRGGSPPSRPAQAPRTQAEEVRLVAKWTEEQKAAALMIAEATSIAEASKRTGIPSGTIKRWRSEGRSAAGEPNQANRTEPNRVSKNEQAALADATARAVERAAEGIADRLTTLADRLYSLAEKAVGKVDVAISDGKRGATHDRDGAAWVRALVGVMAQAIDKAQLLTGKPTSRQAVEGQVRQEYVYEVTQRIISDPGAVDIAQQLLRRAAGRDAGALRVDGQ